MQRVPITRAGPQEPLVTSLCPPFYAPIPPTPKTCVPEPQPIHRSGSRPSNSTFGLGRSLSEKFSKRKIPVEPAAQLPVQLETPNKRSAILLPLFVDLLLIVHSHDPEPDKELSKNPMFSSTRIPGPSYPDDPRQGPHPKIVGIRRELYGIKDEIQAIPVLLETIFRQTPKARRPEDADRAIEASQTLGSAIGTSLTNDGSDWTNAGLGSEGKGQNISYSSLPTSHRKSCTNWLTT
uniref:Uncharacterized protein n=1 Tax=Bionectria ochroleuca TaxID=29856 RepID=A0A8H7KB16_BIOOC